jgi:hypothetical protein
MKYWLLVLVSFLLIVIFLPFPKELPCLSPREPRPDFVPCEPATRVSYSYFDYAMLYLHLPGRLTPERVNPPNN